MPIAIHGRRRRRLRHDEVDLCRPSASSSGTGLELRLRLASRIADSRRRWRSRIRSSGLIVVLVEERPVVAVLDRLGVELQLLAHEVEQARQRLDAGGDEPALDT